MNKVFSKTLIILCCILSVACTEPATTSPHSQKPLTEQYPEKWLVINYWAIWCAPCREEIPELNSFARAYQDQVEVFAVNYDNVSDSELTKQADEIDIQFHRLKADPATELGYNRPDALPTTVFISPDGQVQTQLLGPQTEESLAAALSTKKP